jgi:signal transduction histidine kinase
MIETPPAPKGFLPRHTSIRTRLTLWYVAVLALVLAIYLIAVYLFQYGMLSSQIYHDEIQDVETVEGLLYFTPGGALQLHQEYWSHPQTHLLIDRLMEVRDLEGNVLYRTDTLHDQALGPSKQSADEGDGTFNERTTRLADGTHVLMISHRHPVQGRMLLIRLGYSLAPLAGRMRYFLAALLLALPIALLAAGIAGLQIARRALAPLDTMTSNAELITATNLHGRLVAANEHDELGRMARVMNSLLERLERSFAQLQRFTADAAHELKTPLTSIRATGEAALESNHSDPARLREAISVMLEETARLDQTVEGLLLISRAEANQLSIKPTQFLLRPLVQEIVSLLDVIIEEREISLSEQETDPASTTIFGDRMLIRTAILNVLHNALKFSPPGSQVSLSYAVIQRENQPFLRLSIQDQGPGIEPEDRERVFERFFRVRGLQVDSIEGSGLGLAIARLAVESNHGFLFFDHAPIGALCQLDLPQASGPQLSHSVNNL